MITIIKQTSFNINYSSRSLFLFISVIYIFNLRIILMVYKTQAIMSSLFSCHYCSFCLFSTKSNAGATEVCFGCVHGRGFCLYIQNMIQSVFVIYINCKLVVELIDRSFKNANLPMPITFTNTIPIEFLRKKTLIIIQV